MKHIGLSENRFSTLWITLKNCTRDWILKRYFLKDMKTFGSWTVSSSVPFLTESRNSFSISLEYDVGLLDLVY